MALYANPYGLNAGMSMNPQPFTMNQQPAQIAQNNGINWVQGVEGAKAFSMSPNSNAILMDSETYGRFYIKTCDNIGMCNLRYFDYTETSATPIKPEIDASNFVTKDELTSVIKELKEGMKREQPVPATKQKFNTEQRAATDYKF